MIGFWSYGLFDLDEGIYAASLREMMNRGDAFLITFDGAPFLEKPILVYWVAWGFHILGIGGELGLRLGSVLASIGTMWVSSWFARKHFGDNVGLWTLLILGSSCLFMGVGRMFMPDALLVFFLTCALLLFWESLENVRLRWLSTSAAAFGALAKGPVAPALYVALLAYVGLRLPERRKALKGGWILASMSFVTILGLWYFPIAVSRGGEFFREFLLYQNIGRIIGADVHHRADFYFYVPVIILALAPFVFAMVAAFRDHRQKPVEAFLWAWAIIVFVLFSLAGSKLPHYILPCVPPLAILLSAAVCGDRLARWVPIAWAFAICALGWTSWAVLEPYREVLFVLALGATAGVVLALRTASRGGGFGSISFAAAWSVTVAACVFGVPAYWKLAQRNAFEAAEAAFGDRSATVVEFRMQGLGEPKVISHPSSHYYFGRPARSLFWFDDLLNMATDGLRVLTRRERLSHAHVSALESLGFRCRSEGRWGEYELFSLQKL